MINTGLCKLPVAFFPDKPVEISIKEQETGEIYSFYSPLYAILLDNIEPNLVISLCDELTHIVDKYTSHNWINETAKRLKEITSS